MGSKKVFQRTTSFRKEGRIFISGSIAILACMGCDVSNETAPSSGLATIDIQLASPDSGLVIEWNNQTLATPARITQPAGEKVDLRIVSPQFIDADRNIPGPDIRVDLEWSTGGSKGPTQSVVMGKVGALKIRSRKEFLVFLRGPRGAFPFPDSMLWVAAGTRLRLPAPTLPGLKFLGWTANRDTLPYRDTLSLEIIQPTILLARFANERELDFLSSPDSGLLVGLKDSPTPTPFSLSLVGITDTIIFAPKIQEKDSSLLVPGADVRYVFRRWAEDSATENPMRIKLESVTKRTAEFDKEYKVVLGIDPAEAGKAPPERWVPVGGAVRLRAPPSRDYAFSHWIINGNRFDSGDSIELSADRPIAAQAVYSVPIPDEKFQAMLAAWQSVLGDQGPATADRLISKVTGGCATFSSAEAVRSEGARLRTTLSASLGLDFGKRAKSALVERRVSMPEYTIDIVRLEVFSGIYLPVDIYVPRHPNSPKMPLIISPPGFNSGAGSEEVQIRAANLALMGAIVAIPEGFSSNGARSAIQENNNYVFYARQLLGLPGSTAVFLQELVSLVTWVSENYPVNTDAIGAAGYSYGGGMSLLLGTMDERIKSLSIPATNFGGPCQDRQLNSDIGVEAAYGSGFVWTPPLEYPTTDLNSEITMLFPRYLQETSGSNDPGAPPSTIGPIFDYAKKMYALGGMEKRVLLQTDTEDHNYGPSRRANTYAWFSRSLFGDSAAPQEREIQILPESDLEPDISGTLTLTGELMAKVAQERATRFNRNQPIGDFTARAAQAMRTFATGFPAGTPRVDSAWTLNMGDGVTVRARKYVYGDFAFPVFFFENQSNPDTNRVLYLPKTGTSADLASGPLADIVRHHRQVVSIDYLGLGELKSGRLMLHTFSRYFMYDSPSLPGMVVGMLYSGLKATGGAFSVYANGWASSFFAAALRYVAPNSIHRLILTGLPENELDFLASSSKVPDFLLSGRLFAQTSTLELIAASGIPIPDAANSIDPSKTLILSDKSVGSAAQAAVRAIGVGTNTSKY